MNTANKTNVLLKTLSMKDCNEIFCISREGIVTGNFLQDLQLNENSPIEFTQRLLWLSKGLYTIRLDYDPKKIVGYTLFYRLNVAFFRSLCILSDFYRPAIISQVHEQMSELGKFCYGITTCISKRNPLSNSDMGFSMQLIPGTFTR